MPLLQVAGPSIALASLSEVLAFAIAAATPVPAVRNFAIVAASAVAADFVLQVCRPLTHACCGGSTHALDVEQRHRTQSSAGCIAANAVTAG